MKREIGTIIGKRDVYLAGNTQKRLTLLLGKPRKVKDDEWVCFFRIKGLGKSPLKRAYGFDMLQALLLAIEGLRVTLENHDQEFTWAGGEAGDFGIPRFVPLFFGKEFSDRLNSLIDREVTSFAKKAEYSRRGKKAPNHSREDR